MIDVPDPPSTSVDELMNNTQLRIFTYIICYYGKNTMISVENFKFLVENYKSVHIYEKHSLCILRLTIMQ